MLNRIKSLLPKKSSPRTDESGAYKRQGDECLKLNRLDDAAGCYRSALSINSNNVDACVGLGFVLCEQKQYREAEGYLRQALSIDPGIADAHYILGSISKNQNDQVGAIDHFTRALEIKSDFEIAYRDLFVALFESGHVQKAKDVLDRAISVHPDSVGLHVYLGNVLSHEEDYTNAVPCYQKALQIQPNSVELHKQLADALSKCGKFDLAIASYERAIALNPQYILAYVSLGEALQSQDRIANAIECFRRAIALEPKFVAAHQYLGNALLQQNQKQQAIICFEEVVRLEPENPVKHLIAALTGRDSERAPSGYVEKLFDEYAHKFDSHLAGTLRYSIPEKLANLLRPYSNANGQKWSILDLGCGTGLSGVSVAPYAQQLVGVDLSAKMLDKARERNLYDRLEHMDLLTMMQGEAASSYDVVVAADVFVYLGKLDELVDQTHRVLRTGGLFAFSVEALEASVGDAAAPREQRDYQLNVSGRYAHSVGYLDRLAMGNGFDIESTAGTEVRRDKGNPVEGQLVLWRRSSD